MNSQWWGVNLPCTECRGETSLQLVLFSADGELKFTFYCSKCRKILDWVVGATQLAHRALMCDMDRYHKPHPTNRPLSPPLSKPEKLTEKDKKLLSDFGIDEEGLK